MNQVVSFPQVHLLLRVVHKKKRFLHGKALESQRLQTDSNVICLSFRPHPKLAATLEGNKSLRLTSTMENRAKLQKLRSQCNTSEVALGLFGPSLEAKFPVQQGKPREIQGKKKYGSVPEMRFQNMKLILKIFLHERYMSKIPEHVRKAEMAMFNLKHKQSMRSS